MINTEITLLAATAASIGFVHTLIGPDHYLPFIVLSKARGWNIRKTLFITIICGVGHVLGSILLGAIGLLLGVGVGKLEGMEAFRGNIAAWALFIFGVGYLLWGIYRAWHTHPHSHTHGHGGLLHIHEHNHQDVHDHIHVGRKSLNLTPWVLFILFVLGPCEPLIPLLMYPASIHSVAGVALVSGVFAVATIGTMTAIVALAWHGIEFVRMAFLERYFHAIAGGTIALSAGAILFLGL